MYHRPAGRSEMGLRCHFPINALCFNERRDLYIWYTWQWSGCCTVIIMEIRIDVSFYIPSIPCTKTDHKQCDATQQPARALTHPHSNKVLLTTCRVICMHGPFNATVSKLRWYVYVVQECVYMSQ